jgi:pimeloyl-ACP methyl ester carboxylesterase
LAKLLAPSFTVLTYDRRGRGASGPLPEEAPEQAVERALERELTDLEAVIGAAGGEALLFGHSSGGVLALEAAAAGLPIRGLAVYEPAYHVPGARPEPVPGLAVRVGGLLAEGRADDAMAVFMVEAAAVPPEVVEMMRDDPMWSFLKATAHTLPYDIALSGPDQTVPAGRLAAIAVPALVMVGGASPAWMRAAGRAVADAVPGAAFSVMEGQDHGILQQPEPLAPVLTGFWS